MFDDIFNKVVWASVVLAFAAVAFMLWSRWQHEKFLETHGCQLIVEQPTGRLLMVGKLIMPEHVFVYDCADGTRSEVH